MNFRYNSNTDYRKELQISTSGANSNQLQISTPDANSNADYRYKLQIYPPSELSGLLAGGSPYIHAS